MCPFPCLNVSRSLCLFFSLPLSSDLFLCVCLLSSALLYRPPSFSIVFHLSCVSVCLSCGSASSLPLRSLSLPVSFLQSLFLSRIFFSVSCLISHCLPLSLPLSALLSMYHRLYCVFISPSVPVSMLPLVRLRCVLSLGLNRLPCNPRQTRRSILDSFYTSNLASHPLVIY